jgi:UBX domain-containing protein 1
VPPPKRPLAAFEGTGQRLGSPVPAIAGSSSSRSQSQNIPGAFPVSRPGSGSGAVSPSAPTQQAQAPRQHFEVDFNEPTTSVQVRLANGTR